jgi:hypothetical protein
MAYIGKNLAGVLKESKTVTTMIGDGSDTTLTLSDSPGSVNNVLLFLDGVRQTPVTNYNVSGTALTFSTAPAAGVNVVAVVGNHSGVDTKNLSVTSQKIVDGMVTDSKIATGISSSKITGALPALDGSALTGITAAATPIFKSASDPTITSNKTLGQLWSNSTSGEMYVCTDATTNANSWINVGDGSGSVPAYMSATNTNGTETTDGDYKVVTFNTSGSFTPSIGLDATLGNKVEYLVIAGGGGGGRGGNRGGGGAGAGGTLAASGFTVADGTYTITVGAGGVGIPNQTTNGASGNNSVFSTITALGGGGGRSESISGNIDGGCGGGGAGSTVTTAGTGSQGGNGGTGINVGPKYGGAGGGGKGGVGANGTTTVGGAGGAGLSSSITGSAVTRAGGGGGSIGYSVGGGGAGGSGGGGAGTYSETPNNGGVNLGGGGGGVGGSHLIGSQNGSSGGSGVVIIRYRFQ